MQNSFRLSPFLFKLKDDKFNNYVALKPFNDSHDTDCPNFFELSGKPWSSRADRNSLVERAQILKTPAILVPNRAIKV